jgi:hypothetical protein
MQKLLLSVLLAASVTSAFGQKLEDVQEKMTKKKFDEAKEKIDKAMEDPKNSSNSDAWYLRAQVYSNLAKEKNDTALRRQAVTSLQRYYALEKSKEENKRALKSVMEGHATVFDVYGTYFNEGIKSFQDKNWANSYANFRGAEEVFYILKENKLTTAPVDTNAIFYGGIAAQNGKQFNEAAKNYDKLINAGITDTSFKEMYQYMVSHYLTNVKDTATALRYLSKAESVYPKDRDLWIAYQMDLLSRDREKRMEQYQGLLAKYPNHFELTLNYGVDQFNTAFSSDPKPKDFEGAKAAALKTLEQALAIDPNNAYANYIVSEYYMNEVYDLENTMRAIKGNAPADAKKRVDIKAQIAAKYEQMHRYALRSYESYTAMTDLKGQDKASLRRVTTQLVDYYQYKKQDDKAQFYQSKLKQ